MDYEFEIDETDGVKVIEIAKGYDIDINMSINHDTNWWVYLLRDAEGDLLLEVRVGLHEVFQFEATPDGLQGPDVNDLELKVKGGYHRVKPLSKALSLAASYQHNIVHAIWHLWDAERTVA